jgi:hypothetical protein
VRGSGKILPQLPDLLAGFVDLSVVDLSVAAARGDDGHRRTGQRLRRGRRRSGIRRVDFAPLRSTIRCGECVDRGGEGARRKDARPICGRSRSFADEENAMKFMFMIYHDENVLDTMPEKEMQALVDSAIEYSEDIERSGHYIVSDALQRTTTARTVRVRAGKVTTTDGPFAETKEQLGGFFLIEAKDIDEACAIASRFPPARVGVIEVRPVQELTHSRDRRSLPK